MLESGRLAAPYAADVLSFNRPTFNDPADQEQHYRRAYFEPKEVLMISGAGRILLRTPFP